MKNNEILFGKHLSFLAVQYSWNSSIFPFGNPVVHCVQSIWIGYYLRLLELRKHANDYQLETHYSDMASEIRNTSKQQFQQIISEAAATSSLSSVIDAGVTHIEFIFSRCSSGIFWGSVLWHSFCHFHCSLALCLILRSTYSFLELLNILK